MTSDPLYAIEKVLPDALKRLEAEITECAERYTTLIEKYAVTLAHVRLSESLHKQPASPEVTE